MHVGGMGVCEHVVGDLERKTQINKWNRTVSHQLPPCQHNLERILLGHAIHHGLARKYPNHTFSNTQKDSKCSHGQCVRIKVLKD